MQQKTFLYYLLYSFCPCAKKPVNNFASDNRFQNNFVVGLSDPLVYILMTDYSLYLNINDDAYSKRNRAKDKCHSVFGNLLSTSVDSLL